MFNELLNRKQLSISKSNRILRSFQSLIKVGNSLPKAIEVLALVEMGHTKKILEKVYYDVTELNLTIGTSLHKQGIIKDSEVMLIDKSSSTGDAITSILSIRELSGQFEETILKLFAFPVMAVLIGLTIVYFAQPTFNGMITDLVQQVQVTKGVDVTSDAELMWYLQNRSISLSIMQIYVIFLISSISAYIYFLEYKPEIIYKYLKLKAFDDVPYILMLIHNLQKVGLDQVRIFNILKTSSPRKGWIRLFDLLEREAIAGRYIFTVFEKYSFPRDVTIVLKSAEVSKTFWDNMPLLIEYVQEANKSKNHFLLSTFGSFSPMLGFVIILYFVSGLFMAMFSLQNLAMALL